jgi:hypothetical protein
MSIHCENDKRFAPIALFVYNRPDHTRKTIEALKNNVLACESDLIIFSDGPKNSEKDIKNIEEVRKICSETSGFKNVIVKCSSQNRGLARAIIVGVTQMCNEYGKVIVMEDDLISSPYFLVFMNEALDKYASSEKVSGISAYTFPLERQRSENFFLKYSSSWGWATWKRAWQDFEEDGNLLLNALRKRKQFTRFDFNGSYVFSKMLKQQVQKLNDSWAIRWYASIFLKDKLVFFPKISLINNIGNDGSGIHSEATKHFDTVLANRKIDLTDIEIRESIKAFKEYEEYFKKIRPFILIRIQNRLIKMIKKQFRERSYTRTH